MSQSSKGRELIDSTQARIYLETIEKFFPKVNRIEWLREYMAKKPESIIDPNFKCNLTHGWLRQYLLDWDLLTWQRWIYLAEVIAKGVLPERGIPQIEFSFGDNGTNSAKSVGSLGRKHLEKCLDLIPNSGAWKDEYFNYFLDWLLFAFGHSMQKEEPMEPTTGASMRLYQHFDLGYLALFPWDYFGSLLSEKKYGREVAFYPSAHSIPKTMSAMLFDGISLEGKEDLRLHRVFEPACGTGRMLMYASNYTLCVSGADVDKTLLKSCVINGYLYAPWLVKPITFLQTSSTQSASK